jgi:hypothetical protein
LAYAIKKNKKCLTLKINMMNKFLFFFCILATLSSQLAFSDENKAMLKARLHIVPSNAYEMKTAKIQPGSSVKIQAEVKNIGTVPNAPGKIFVRFSLTQPMEDLLESRTFQTETLALPTIYPGQVIMIEFEKQHQWPSLTDFIKQNWNMRHYQAVIKIDEENQEKIIGYLPIFFSAYYYEGLSHETPAEVKPRKK